LLAVDAIVSAVRRGLRDRPRVKPVTKQNLRRSKTCDEAKPATKQDLRRSKTCNEAKPATKQNLRRSKTCNEPKPQNSKDPTPPREAAKEVRVATSEKSVYYVF
jgi:hypothetical protein